MRQKNNVPQIVVTDLSNRIHYYQWFVYGLYLLASEGKISLKFAVPCSQRLLLLNHSSFLVRCQNKIMRIMGGGMQNKRRKLIFEVM